MYTFHRPKSTCRQRRRERSWPARLVRPHGQTSSRDDSQTWTSNAEPDR
jgi:hypothetical protein